jgi:SAM-dependent methyltransferase
LQEGKNNMKQGAERYSDKTEDYAKYRPDFPVELIDFLYINSGASSTSVIADIGSGTGRFTRPLLEKGNFVYGIEQNNEMRIKAEKLLSPFSKFISIAGSAEKTGLMDKSLDLITVAQAFHWFNKEKTFSEFKRIIKDNGNIFIVWDDLVGDYNNFSKEFSNVLGLFRNVQLKSGTNRYTRNEMIDGFFKDNKYITASFIHEVYQSFESIKGGALSASFTPKPGEENYKAFVLELEKVFDKFQHNGCVCTAFRSVCYLGRL